LTLAPLRGTVAIASGERDMTGRSSLFGVALAGFLALCAAIPASAASLLELNFGLSGPRYDAYVPLCNDPAVLGKISSNFAQKEATYWTSTLDIVGVDRIREIAFRPWAADTIPRRFCSGIAEVSDGKRRPIYYSVNETGGWIGAGWGVEWCVVGLDRNWAYNPGCRMARP
jgi:hypothetical protein